MEDKNLNLDEFSTVINVILHDDKKFGELINEIDKFAKENAMLKDSLNIFSAGMNTVRGSLTDAQKSMDLKNEYISTLEKKIGDLKEKLREVL